MTATRGSTTVRSGLLALLLALALLATTAPSAVEAQTTWTPASEATVRPGVQLLSESGQCTANFIFTDGADVLIGSAAHCTGLGEATDTNGCLAGSLPRGSRVDVEGADHPATLVYSSWLTMQERGEQDGDACAYNDFALLKLDTRDHAKVNPTIPHWGGPVALGSSSSVGERVFSYGNSSLRLGLDLLKPKTGLSLGQGGGGWTHSVYTVTPGIPGDSGSAFLDGQGRALGTLSTLAIAPLPASNGVTDLNLALAYANRHGNVNARLATGTEPFQPNQLPIGGIGLPGLPGGLGDGAVDGAPSLGVEVSYSILGREGRLRL